MNTQPNFDADMLNEAFRLENLRSRVAFFPTLESTNAQAMSEALKGAPAFNWIVADAQTAGRGRLGRSWVSPAGRNLYASCVLRPTLSAAEMPRVSLAVAIAVHRAVSAIGAEALIKWPNDIQINGRKLAGVLCEAHSDGDRIEAVIAGIGLNIGMDEADFPPELRDSATSLRIEGVQADRMEIFQRLARALETTLATLENQGFAALHEEWNAVCALRGRQVEITSGPETHAGTVAGIDAEGYLLLVTPGGTERVAAGEVSVKK
jgi:BirA family transcriptional regulator, biotin operon repressor / biotin---[acetyl-CoA-carboxylase] ligase